MIVPPPDADGAHCDVPHPPSDAATTASLLADLARMTAELDALLVVVLAADDQRRRYMTASDEELGAMEDRINAALAHPLVCAALARRNGNG